MIHLSDEAILEGVRLRSDFVINYIYKDYFPLIKFLVTQNSGSAEDAEDVFQDGVIIIYNLIIVGQLKLTCSFKTYMYSVCRNLWLQKLAKRKAIFDRLTDIEGYIDLPTDMLQESGYEETELHRLIQIHFLSLPEDCQKILKMFVKKNTFARNSCYYGF
jgi:RNA polymerase sigma factor (sigma-70 family)